MIIREYRPFVVMPARMVNDKNLEGIDYRVYGCMLHAIENDEKMISVTNIANEISKKLNENERDIYKSLARLEFQKYINTNKKTNSNLVIEILGD